MSRILIAEFASAEAQLNGVPLNRASEWHEPQEPLETPSRRLQQALAELGPMQPLPPPIPPLPPPLRPQRVGAPATTTAEIDHESEVGVATTPPPPPAMPPQLQAPAVAAMPPASPLPALSADEIVRTLSGIAGVASHHSAAMQSFVHAPVALSDTDYDGERPPMIIERALAAQNGGWSPEPAPRPSPWPGLVSGFATSLAVGGLLYWVLTAA